jgi:hypothetical protein
MKRAMVLSVLVILAVSAPAKVPVTLFLER